MRVGKIKHVSVWRHGRSTAASCFLEARTVRLLTRVHWLWRHSFSSKLFSSPHLIGHDAEADQYNRL